MDKEGVDLRTGQGWTQAENHQSRQSLLSISFFHPQQKSATCLSWPTSISDLEQRINLNLAV